MTRQKILKSQVESFSLDLISKRILEDPEGFFKDFEAFSIRNLTINDAALGLDRKTLYSWKKHGLLPFSGTPSKGGKGKSWGRFSFIELSWLKLLMELRQVGIGLDKLKEMNAFFFDEDFIENFFRKPIEDTNKLPEDSIRKLSEKQILKDGKVHVTEEIKKFFEEIQFSLFSCLLYSTMLSRSNYVLCADGKGKFDVVDLNQLTNDPIIGVMDFHRLLNTDSVVFVNIKKIIADLSGTHEHFSKELNLGQILSDSSVNALKDLFRDGKVKEVTFRVNEVGRPLVWIKREMKMEDLKKELKDMSKKGNYCDLVIKTRDGQVQYFEHTEIVKL